MVAESTRPRVLFAQHMGPHKFLDVLPRLWWFVLVVVPSSPNLHQPKHLVSIQCTDHIDIPHGQVRVGPSRCFPSVSLHSKATSHGRSIE